MDLILYYIILSYLRLKWTKPTLELAGTYTCIIGVMTARYLPDMLSASVQVVGNEPRIVDLVSINDGDVFSFMYT